MRAFCWVLNPKTGKRLVARYKKEPVAIAAHMTASYRIDLDYDEPDREPAGRIGSCEIHSEKDDPYCFIDSGLNLNPRIDRHANPAYRYSGNGAALYFAAAMLAERLGKQGIQSYRNIRSSDANRFWDRLASHRLTSSDGYYDFLDAAAVRSTGLIVRVAHFKL